MAAEEQIRQLVGQAQGLTTEQCTLLISLRIAAMAQASFGSWQLRGKAESMRAPDGTTSKAPPPVPVFPRAPDPVAAARDEGPPLPPDRTHAEEARSGQLRACAAAHAAVDGLIRELGVARVGAGSEASAIRSDSDPRRLRLRLRSESSAIRSERDPKRVRSEAILDPKRVRSEAFRIRGGFHFQSAPIRIRWGSD